jgi:hypothetical protein
MSGCISNSEKSDNIAMRRATAGCCARAVSGHTSAALPSADMNCRLPTLAAI